MAPPAFVASEEARTAEPDGWPAHLRFGSCGLFNETRRALRKSNSRWFLGCAQGACGVCESKPGQRKGLCKPSSHGSSSAADPRPASRRPAFCSGPPAPPGHSCHSCHIWAPCASSANGREKGTVLGSPLLYQGLVPHLQMRKVRPGPNWVKHNCAAPSHWHSNSLSALSSGIWLGTWPMASGAAPQWLQECSRASYWVRGYFSLRRGDRVILDQQRARDFRGGALVVSLQDQQELFRDRRHRAEGQPVKAQRAGGAQLGPVRLCRETLVLCPIPASSTRVPGALWEGPATYVVDSSDSD